MGKAVKLSDEVLVRLDKYRIGDESYSSVASRLLDKLEGKKGGKGWTNTVD